MSSGLGGFLFGNIDEEGRLDNEDFDEELRANLTTFSERIQDKKLLLEGGFLAEEIIREFSSDDAKQSQQLNQNRNVVPLPEAENFEDITELAEATATELLIEKENEPIGLVEPLNNFPINNLNDQNSSSTTKHENYIQFDNRQILKFTQLSAKPSLLNATGRSYSRYASLRKLRLKRKQLYSKGTVVSMAENQLESFLNRSSASTTSPSAASARLRLSLVNLSGSTTSVIFNAKVKKSWNQSLRFHELERSLNKTRSQLSKPSSFDATCTLEKTVNLPNNSHFHPIALLDWENEIIWDISQDARNTTAKKGMFVSLTNSLPLQQSSQTQPSNASGGGGAASKGSTSTPVTNTSLSSILSSLSLSNGSLGGGDSASSSATATALLALIRNQQMRSASTTSISTSSMNSGRPPLASMSRVNTAISINPSPGGSVKLKFPKAASARILNRELELGNWSDSIIWNVLEIDPSNLQTHLILPLDDPELIFTPLPVENLSKKLGRAEKLIAKRLKKLQTGSSALNSFSKPVMDKFNLSNDKYYESVGGNENDNGTSNKSNSNQKSVLDHQNAVGKAISSTRSSVSASFLGLHHSVPALQHSVPALKLSPPAFQTCRTKRELRLWHRPRLSIPPGFAISTWLKVKSGTKKQQASNNSSNITEVCGGLTFKLACNPSGGIIRSSKKLTLKDSSRFVLLEYFEEFPPLLMNPGMGAYVVLYYRKKSPQDTFVPRNTFAIVQVLDFTDPSPFMMFGDVPAGCSRYALCNGLFRAPLFPQKAASSDFIVSRHCHQLPQDSSFNASPEAEFYLRPVEGAPVMLVGQEFPLVEVPGPHSRRHNMFCRQRLQVAAYRLFKKDQIIPENGHSRRRLKIGRLLTAFPQFSEGSIRKWLKEYAESTRAGKDSGLWLLKDDAPQLDEDELRALVTPEALCQYESMMAEQQRLTDAEIILYDPFNTNSPSTVDDVVNDENEGGTNPERQTKVKSKEMEDLISAAPWNTTSNFLGAVQGRCTLKLRGIGDPSGRGEAFSFVKAPGEKGTSSSIANSVGSEYRQDISRIWEAHTSSLSLTAGNTAIPVPVSFTTPNSIPEQSKLIISRRFGADQWITEEINDPLIIKAYLRVRHQQSSSSTDKIRRGFVAPDALPVLSAADAAPLSTGTRSGKKPKSTKVSTVSTTAGTKTSSNSVKGIDKNLQIKCGACGQVGHMRTNRICPIFTEGPLSNTVSVKSTPFIPVSSNSLQTVPKLKLKLSANSSASSSCESVYPSPVLVPVSHRPKGPPIEPIAINRKRPRKLSPKQEHALFLSLLSVQVRSKLASLSTILISIVDSLILLPTTPAFHKPVSRKLYPLYYKLITNPIDLNSIRSKAVALSYKSSKEFFLNDFRLLCTNCETFNGIDAPLSSVARDMLTRVEAFISENNEIEEAENYLKRNISNENDQEYHVDVDNSDNVDQGVEVSILTDGDEDVEVEVDAEIEIEAETLKEEDIKFDVGREEGIEGEDFVEELV